MREALSPLLIFAFMALCLGVGETSPFRDEGIALRDNSRRTWTTGAEDFSSSLCVQTGSGAHPASYSMGTGGSFPGGKTRPGRDADHSPPSSAEVENE
jgi:hypothetical protein